MRLGADSAGKNRRRVRVFAQQKRNNFDSEASMLQGFKIEMAVEQIEPAHQLGDSIEPVD